MAYGRRCTRRRRRTKRKTWSKRTTNRRQYGKLKTFTARGSASNYRKVNGNSLFYLPRLDEHPSAKLAQYRTNSTTDLVIDAAIAPTNGNSLHAWISGAAAEVDIFGAGGTTRPMTSSVLPATQLFRNVDDGISDGSDRTNKAILAGTFQRGIVKKCTYSMAIRNNENFPIVVCILTQNATRAEDPHAGGLEVRRTKEQQANSQVLAINQTREQLAIIPGIRQYVIPARPSDGSTRFDVNKRIINVMMNPQSAARLIDRFQDNFPNDANSYEIAETPSLASPANVCGFQVAIVPYESDQKFTTATVGSNLVAIDVKFKMTCYQTVMHYGTEAPILTA